MEKILVATDLSTDSIAGICFAVQLSAQKELRLVFPHVNKLMKDETVLNPEHTSLLRQERENLLKEMDTFIRSISVLQFLCSYLISHRSLQQTHKTFSNVPELLQLL